MIVIIIFDDSHPLQIGLEGTPQAILITIGLLWRLNLIIVLSNKWM